MAKRKVAERWFSIAEMAGFLGMSVPGFRALHLSMGAPHQEKRGKSKTSPIFINSRRWLEAWRGDNTSRVEDAEAEIKEIELAMARLKLRHLQGQLLDVDQFSKERLYPFCDRLRTSLETLMHISAPGFDHMQRGLEESLAAFHRNGHSDHK